MTFFLNPRILDDGLGRLTAEGTRLDICTSRPTSYGAMIALSLGNKTGLTLPAPSDRSPTGRRVVVPAITDGTVTGTGTATHYAISDPVNGRLLAAHLLDVAKPVATGGVFTLASFSVGIPSMSAPAILSVPGLLAAYDMTDGRYLWADTARTTPISGTIDQGIAGVTDLSGNGFHLEQATPANRPLVRVVNGVINPFFDGITDRMTSVIPINYAGSDAVTVVAAVRKLSDASSTRAIVESAPASTNDGTYGMFGPRVSGEPGFTFASKGTTDRQAVVATGYAAPFKGVITGIGRISTDTSILRIDGTQVASNTGDQGTGTLTNATLNVGFRSGGFFFFSGHIAGIAIFNTVLTGTDLTNAEAAMGALVP
jgi:hypothetical protein